MRLRYAVYVLNEISPTDSCAREIKFDWANMEKFTCTWNNNIPPMERIILAAIDCSLVRECPTVDTLRCALLSEMYLRTINLSKLFTV